VSFKIGDRVVPKFGQHYDGHEGKDLEVMAIDPRTPDISGVGLKGNDPEIEHDVELGYVWYYNRDLEKV